VPLDTDLEKVRKLVKSVGQQMLKEPELADNFLQSLLRNFRLKRRKPAVGRGMGGVEGRRDGRQHYAIARFVVFFAFRTDFRWSLRRL